ncbi:DUF2493 domain-containing protein [Nocardiopsis sp. FR26]|uniref:DUF2493 domain-containing protein n=1 Tax=Nocardiopsis sp. FR26 TaxID=2605987 RepID=UPI00135A2954|nr:DUF2493 domain-containing protein [Nocardiopsis sp. FR26]
MSRRVIVTGGRDYTDQNTVARTLQSLYLAPLSPGNPPTLVHGGAPGADRLAAKYAHAHYWPVHEFPANWRRHGPAAGPIRNQQMADAGADLCIAFPGGRGTADMVSRAKAAGIPVRLVP